MNEFDVVITTYEILVSEANWFRRKFVWRVLIVDEGHRLKVRRCPTLFTKPESMETTLTQNGLFTPDPPPILTVL